MFADATHLINLLTALWFGAVGACVGSFLNVVAYRLPRRLSVVWRSSRCPQCGHAIRAWHNLPVFGWLLLRGRCYDCGSRIAPRYALVEAVLGAAFVTLAYAELYRGGANLPAGPLTRADDALDMFLRPHWPLLAIFAIHGLLLSILCCVALLQWDRLAAPQELAIAAALAALTLAGYFPQGFDPQTLRPLAEFSGVSGGAVREIAQRLDGLCGAALAAPLAACALASSWRRRTDFAWWNASVGVGAVGGVLGVRPALAVLLVVACWEAACSVLRPAFAGGSRWTWVVGGLAAWLGLCGGLFR